MTTWPYPLWIAHRGAGKLAPENTLAAFAQGAQHGYRAFECDVKLSSEGAPFLLHDDTLERTTDGHGVAGQRPWSELSQLDAGSWHGPQFIGEPIPSFEAIARFCQSRGFGLNVEIKPTTGLAAETGRVVARETARLWRDEEAVKPLLSSFQVEALVAARNAQPELPRALLLDKPRADWLNVVRDLGCMAVVTNFRMMDDALMRQIHEAGLRALCYTVNDPAVAQTLIDLGIDGLITDAVDRFDPSKERDAARQLR